MTETETSLPLTPQSKRLRADSIGEELYLVHLHRMSAPDPHPEDAEDDHDIQPPRHPMKTVGEELFAVHLRRSQGVEPDYDVDLAEEDKKPAAAGGEEAEDPQGTKCSYSLRSMDKKTE